MERETQSFGTRVRRSLGTFAKGLALGGVAAAVGGLTLVLHEGFREFEHQQKVVAQTNAVLKSTQAVSGTTAQSIDELAKSIQNYSGIDNEAIQAGENLLLTFTHIRNRVGEGNDVFDQATKSVIDLSVAMGLDARKAALQVGKALNAPERGYSRLQRIGVQFTKTQVAMIKQFVRQGREMDAQKVILAELNTEFGGSAKALGDTFPGRLNKLREGFKNFAGELVVGLVPSLEHAVASLTAWFDNTENQVRVQERIERIVETGRKVIEGFVGAVRAATPVVRSLTSAVGGTENAVKLLVAAMAVAKVREFAIALGLVGPAGVKAALGIGAAAAATEAATVSTVRFAGGLAAMEAAAVLRFGAVGAVAGRLLSTLVLLRNPITIVIGIELLRGGRELKAIKAGISEVVTDFGDGKIHDALFGRPLVTDKEKQQIDALNDRFKLLPKGARESIQAAARELAKDPTKPLKQRLVELEHLFDRLRGKTAAAASASIEGIRATTAASLARTEAFGNLAAIQGGDTLGGGVTADQRNTWFDQMIGRRLDRAGDIRSLEGQLAQYEQIAGLLKQRIAKTKDVTRLLTLEDKLLQVGRSISATRQAIADEFVDSLQLGIDRAQLTRGLQDDLAAVNSLIAGLQRQVSQQGRSNDLSRQLIAAQSQRNALLDQIQQNEKEALAKRKAQRDARQFRRLGLTSTGEEPVPGVRLLKRQLNTVEDAVSGTFLDNKKTKGILGRIKFVLSGQMGAVSREVRSTVHDMLSDINRQLDGQQRHRTKFKQTTINQTLAGLGLDPAQVRALRGRLSNIGTGGQVANRTGGVGAFGMVLAPAEHTTVVVVDGKVVETAVTKRQQRRRRRSSTQKRGPQAA